MYAIMCNDTEWPQYISTQRQWQLYITSGVRLAASSMPVTSAASESAALLGWLNFLSSALSPCQHSISFLGHSLQIEMLRSSADAAMLLTAVMT